MFWNKKKKEDELCEEDLPEFTEEADENDGSDADITEASDNNSTDEDVLDENGEDFDPEEYFGEDGISSEDDGTDVTVTVKAVSLNGLAEFVSMRHTLNLQFMKKDTLEVFELRESHLRIARVWGTVSMSRECSKAEYAKIMLAVELLKSPDDFYVLPALTESDLKKAIGDFCEEKYPEKSKKYSGNPKKFAKIVEVNGDEEEWKLFVKELLYKKTEDFCNENGIIFPETDGESEDE